MDANNRKFNLLALSLSLVITLGIASVASFFTIREIPGWYQTLNKPSFNPPNQVFGPVWSILYVMIGVSACLVWQRRDTSEAYSKARVIYFTQLLFNFMWSIVFFGMHQVLAALVVIGLLWISIVMNIYCFGRISKVAAWLLVPYLLWVSFASMLNLYIYLLNR